MMQKVINILIISVYLSLSVGLNVLLHTCGDHTSAFVMPVSVQDPCESNGSHSCVAKEPCCKLELRVFHITDSQLQTQVFQNGNVFVQAALNAQADGDLSLHFYASPFVQFGTSPPITIPRHILDCAFLI